MYPYPLKYLDLTLPTPAENLACDEALVDLCDDGYQEILRFWEPPEYFIVLGYSSRIRLEVNLPSCQSYHIPILRRMSGGGAVLQGPGCLNYSLILRIRNSAPLAGIAETNAFVMGSLKETLQDVIGSEIGIQGFTDLSLRGLKFSGNAQYRRRRCLLFHGTFLLYLDAALMEKLLPMPSRRPPYRRDRSHREFLTNLPMLPLVIKEALKESWRARETLHNVPHHKIHELAVRRYSREEWNMRL